MGDMWLCRRLGIVRVTTGHNRTVPPKKRAVLTHFHLYHWEKPMLRARPPDWRDGDPNAFRDRLDPSEVWEYVGNIFDRLPYASFLKGWE